MLNGGFVYIICSPNKGAVYVGVTSDIKGRIWQHKNKVHPDSYSAKYNCNILVYYREFDNITDAIAEEKRIKGGSRIAKERLIDSINPEWKDLYEEVVDKY